MAEQVIREYYDYQSVLRSLRDAIGAGVYRPGEALPSERDLAKRFRMGRDPVRQAVDVLVHEGVLTRCEMFKPARVAESPAREPVLLLPGARVTARMPDPQEARTLGLAARPGVPVLVVSRPDRPDEIYPAHAVALCVEDRPDP